jgi:hypothetical protein
MGGDREDLQLARDAQPKFRKSTSAPGSFTNTPMKDKNSKYYKMIKRLQMRSRRLKKSKNEEFRD